jgi:hypothetical protein
MIQLLVSYSISIWENLSFLFWAIVLFCFLPGAAATTQEMPFPDIPFTVFSEFVGDNFSSTISLSTVLCLLFTITNNPDLLNLHAKQQNYAKQKTSVTGWLKNLGRAVHNHFNNETQILKESEKFPGMSNDEGINILSSHLEGLAKVLHLYPYNSQGKFQGKVKEVSHKEIQPVLIICPRSYKCETIECNSHPLNQITKPRDIPSVTLIKDFAIHENAIVLTGKCSQCQVLYTADHERAPVQGRPDKFSKVYLNLAKYLKIGQSIWVDRLFTSAVVNGMYNFHASAAAYMQFWNDTVWVKHSGSTPKISCCQIWQAFVQESIRTVALAHGFNLELNDKLSIGEVTKHAFEILGENGIIAAASGHSCSECTHKYKETADSISQHDSDEDRAHSSVSDHDMDIDAADVTMVVVDGIVTGPTVSKI